MTFREFIQLVHSDFFRYMRTPTMSRVISHWFLSPGVKYSFYMRLCRYLRGKPLKAFGLLIILQAILHHYRIKFGIDIPDTTTIGSGFYIGHFGGIVVNSHAVIGKDCNISHGVTIGQLNRGERMGCPVIGARVFIGPGAKILGRVTIGDDVAIGANCVVVTDIPANSVVVGNPGKVISQEGSTGYVNNIDY